MKNLKIENEPLSNPLQRLVAVVNVILILSVCFPDESNLPLNHGTFVMLSQLM